MIKLENVSKFYHNEGNVVLGLHRVNLEFKMGEFVAITGESGSGKSTLLNVISGLDSYEEGELYFNGEETSHYDEEDWQEYRKNNIGFVFQNYHLIDSYTVLENVESVMIINGISKKARRKRALEILKQVGLEKHLKHKGTKLSGGEKQRLAIARAIAKDTPVIVADEPTGNLDTKTGKQIIEILKELSKTKLVIMVTHNHDLIDGEVSRIVRLYDAKVVEDRVIEEPNPAVTTVIQNQEVSTFKKAFSFAFLNFKNQPKTTLLSLLVTVITTFLVSFMFVMMLDVRASVIVIDNYVFDDSIKTRILVTKKDPFTQAELEELAKLDNVDYIVTEDLIYNTSGYIQHLTPTRTLHQSGRLRKVSEISTHDLLCGRLPENEFEIVISNVDEESKEFIDKKIQFFSLEPTSRTDFINNTYQVVGVVKSTNDEEPYIYFTEERLSFLNKHHYTLYSHYEIYILYTFYNFNHVTFEIDNTIPNKQIALEVHNPDFNFASEYLRNYPLELRERVAFGYINIITHHYDISDIRVIMEGNYQSSVIIKMNYEEFDKLTARVNRQVSVYVKDYHKIKETIKQIENLNYDALDPEKIILNEDLYTMLSQILVSLFFMLLIFGVYIISSLIINAIFTNKLRDIVILKSMGLDSKSANLMTILQISTYFLISIILLFPTIILLTQNSEVFGIVYVLFKWHHYVILFVINIILGIYVAVRVNRSVHKKSIISSMKAE